MTLDSAGLDALIADVEGASNESFRRDWLLLRLRYARSLAAAAPPTGENPDGPMTEALWKYAQNEWGWGADDYEACRDAITAVVAAGRAAATPDPPPPATPGENLHWSRGYAAGYKAAVSPDERLREALTFYADAGNYVGGEVGWWGADHRGEPVWCMDFGSIARNALAADREAPDEPKGQKITHGRHCTCTPCAVEDWTNPAFTPCGMHGKDCPQEYQPLGPAGSFAPPADEPKETT